MAMKFFVNWDVSGVSKENMLTSTCFLTNKNYKCKDVSGVAIDGVDSINNSVNINVVNRLGGNDIHQDCLIISVDKDKVPIYVKEIDIFIHCPNFTKQFYDTVFHDLEFFNIYVEDSDSNNKKLAYSLTSKANFQFDEVYSYEEKPSSKDIHKIDLTGLFLIGKLVRVNNDFIFSPVFKFIDKNIIDLGKQYDIDFVIQSEVD